MPGMDHVLCKGFLATGGSVAYKQFQVVKQVAETTLIPAQCAIMQTADTAILPLGVVQEPLDAAKTVTGKAIVSVAMTGNTKVIVGTTTNCAVGAYAIPSRTVAGACDFVSGLVGTSAGEPVVGRVIGIMGNSIGQAVTAGDLIDVELTPGVTIYAT